MNRLSRFDLRIVGPPAVIFVGVLLLFYGEALLPGRVLLPTDIIAGRWPPWQQPGVAAEVNNDLLADPINYIYPVKKLAVDQLRRGVFPLWNPYTLGGYPLTYNTQVGLFYPATLVYLVLQAAAAVDAVIIGQLALGGLFMFLYLGRLGVDRRAALWGALLFAFNGHMTIWLEWQVVHAAVIWLPLQLWFAEGLAAERAAGEAIDRRRLRRQVSGLAVAFALPWLGGHWNWAIYTSMTVGVYLLFRLHAGPRRQINWAGIGRAAAGLGLGSLLALVQVWPAFTYLSQTHRQPLPYSELTTLYGLGSRAAAWLVPHFYGSTQAGNYWIVDIARSNDIEATVYLGLLPLFLGLLVLFWRRDWPAWFFTLWGGLGLLWTLGTPAYRLLYWLPVFNALFPGRAAIIPIFSLTVLAALALDRLIDRAAPDRFSLRPLLFVAAFLLAVVGGFSAVYWEQVQAHREFLTPEIARFLLLFAAAFALLALRGAGRLAAFPFLLGAYLLLVADLWFFAAGFNTIGRVDEIYPTTSIEQFLLEEQRVEPHRIITTGRETAFFPNTSQIAGIENISGYEPGVLRRVLNYLRLAEDGEVIRLTRFVMPEQAVQSPLLAAANVKYLVTIADRWEASPVVALAQGRRDQVVSLPARWPLAMPEAGLQRVDLWLIPPAGGAGTAVLRVLSADESYEFAHDRVPLAGVESPGWVSFFFNPFPSEWGREFVLAAEIEGGPAGEISGSAAGPAFTAYYLPRPLLVKEAGKTRVYFNEGAFPRAFAVHAADIVAGEAAALAALAANQDRLRERVVLELEGQPAPNLPADPPAGRLADIQVRYPTLNRVEIDADLAADGLVVLADNYYPGWVAAVDGRPAPVYRANSIFRAVPVPAGNHRVTLVFRPPDFIAGGLVSAAALLICLIGLLAPGFPLRRARR